MTRAWLPALLLLPALAAETSQAGPSKLKIVVVEGEGAVNNIRKRAARDVVVEVRDENDRPVPGASVTFILPPSGPGGVFPSGSNIVATVSDERGQAAAIGLRPNDVAGEFQIRVTASHQGRTASASITQTNVGAPRSRIPGKVVAVAVLAGGAAAAILIARQGAGADGDKSARPVLVPGTPQVGAPR